MATPRRSPISPMSGHSPATSLRAIRTGSWLAPEALSNATPRRLYAVALRDRCRRCALAPSSAFAAHVPRRITAVRRFQPSSPAISAARLAASKSPAANMRRWHGPISRAGPTTIISPPTRLFAPVASRSRRSASRRPIRRRSAPRCAIPAEPRRSRRMSDGAKARAFFEEHSCPCGFRGSAKPKVSSPAITSRSSTARAPRPKSTTCRSIAGRRTCSCAAPRRAPPSLPNKGEVFRKIGRRKLVPYYDRAEIEDGAIAGRGLEIVLAEEPDRSAVHADPGLGARPARGRLDHAHQLRCA